MKNIGITGASSGIGLEIKTQLKSHNIIDFSITNGFDLTNEKHLQNVIDEVRKNNIDVLFLNAGINIIKPIGKYTNQEINDIMDLNFNSNVKIMNALSPEIIFGKLKIIVTLSTASFINGVDEAIYNASKKALKEFIVSFNTEIKVKESNSRIFMFVPSYVPGTGMTGGEKNINELRKLVSNMLLALKNGDDRYIHRYEEVFKRVFKEYQDDPIGQGIRSVEYRKNRD